MIYRKSYVDYLWTPLRVRCVNPVQLVLRRLTGSMISAEVISVKQWNVSPKIQPRWPFLIRSFIQLAIRERRVLSRHLWVADTAIKKTWINSEARCITVTQLCLHPLEIVRELIFSSWLSYNPPHSMYAFMLMFNKQLVPSFKTDCTAHPPPSISSSLSPPVKGESLACVPSPPRSPILCLPHQTFIVSLCFSEIITAGPMIGRNTMMDGWCFCFRGFYCTFALFIVAPSHGYTKVSWNGMIFFGKCWSCSDNWY